MTQYFIGMSGSPVDGPFDAPGPRGKRADQVKMKETTLKTKDGVPFTDGLPVYVLVGVPATVGMGVLRCVVDRCWLVEGFDGKIVDEATDCRGNIRVYAYRCNALLAAIGVNMEAIEVRGACIRAAFAELRASLPETPAAAE